MKLKHFYKIDHNKQPIPGSNIKRKTKPGNQWKEILDPCCSPTDIDCTCGPRFFVQIDGGGKPVPGTLIKRNVFPKMEEGIKYMEIDWKSPCCPSIEFSYVINFIALDIEPTAKIYVNGNLMAVGGNGINTSGVFKVKPQDIVRVVIESETNCSSYTLTSQSGIITETELGNSDQNYTIQKSNIGYSLVIGLLQGDC